MTSEGSPLIYRMRRNVQTDGGDSIQIEVQARVTNDEEKDRETASCAYEFLQCLASLLLFEDLPDASRADGSAQHKERRTN